MEAAAGTGSSLRYSGKRACPVDSLTITGGRSISAVDAEVDDIVQREFPRRGRKEFEGIARHGAVMPGPLNRILERTVLVQGFNCGGEVALANVTLFQRSVPKFPLLFCAAAEREDDRQSDFPFPEIVADILAEFGRCSTIVERVIDELEGDAEIEPIAAARRNLCLRLAPEKSADFRGSAEQRCRLGANHCEIIVLACFGIFGGGKLHDLAFGDHDGGC